ncbi:MAG: DUF4184 family protein [Polyangiaceae bacterium]
MNRRDAMAMDLNRGRAFTPDVPFPLLAHQLPVLPLLFARRGKESAIPLVLGTIVPDLDYLGPSTRTVGGHSPVGLAFVAFPLTLLLTALFRHFLIPALAVFGPGVVVAVGANERARLRAPFRERTFGDVLAAAVGVASHGILDALTHRDSAWVARIDWLRRPVLRFAGMDLPGCRVLHYGLSIFGSAVVLVVLVVAWRRSRRNVAVVSPATRVPVRRTVGLVFWSVPVVLAAVVVRTTLRRILVNPSWYFEYSGVYAVGYAAFVAVVAFVAGLVLLSVAFSGNAAVRTERSRARGTGAVD